MDTSHGLTRHIEALRDARSHTLQLVADLDEQQIIGPRFDIVNPLRWEIGHIAWFQEYWLLRHLLDRPPILLSGDALYDSAKVAHETRWDLPLASKVGTINYAQDILDQVIDQYDQQPATGAGYFLSLALFHEDMHAEAITYTRQTLGYSAPKFITLNEIREQECTENVTHKSLNEQSLTNDNLGDAFIHGGTFVIGSQQDQPFVFDNELRAHEVQVDSFSISRTAVTNAEYAAFVDDRGYARRELWSDDGWQWRELTAAEHPVYWRFAEGQWRRRNFDQMVQLEDYLPVVHVNWYEADAFCRWAHRRLPTEPEWETAASAEPAPDGRGLTRHKRRFPWGDSAPTPQRANLDWRGNDCVDVRLLPQGDSAFGCRQMIGNVWEWTASDFKPYPGFIAGPYKEYSAPWFGDHKVLRGGSWTTRSRLIHSAYRNFYKPDRRDVWAGFRTCAL